MSVMDVFVDVRIFSNKCSVMKYYILGEFIILVFVFHYFFWIKENYTFIQKIVIIKIKQYKKYHNYYIISTMYKKSHLYFAKFNRF